MWGALLVTADRQAHHLDRIARPSTEDRRSEPQRRVGPDRCRVGGRETAELPVPVTSRVLGDPASSVRVAIVLPDLLETHDVGVQLVEPVHDLVSTLPPPSTDKRIDVELHDPQHPLGHTHTLPVMSATPPARSGAERAPMGCPRRTGNNPARRVRNRRLEPGSERLSFASVGSNRVDGVAHAVSVDDVRANPTGPLCDRLCNRGFTSSVSVWPSDWSGCCWRTGCLGSRRGRG